MIFKTKNKNLHIVSVTNDLVVRLSCAHKTCVYSWKVKKIDNVILVGMKAVYPVLLPADRIHTKIKRFHFCFFNKKKSFYAE